MPGMKIPTELETAMKESSMFQQLIEAPRRVTEQIIELNSNSRFRKTSQNTVKPALDMKQDGNGRRIVGGATLNYRTPFQEELEESVMESIENTAVGNKEGGTLVLN